MGLLMLAAVCFQCAVCEHEEAKIPETLCFWLYEVSGVRAGNVGATGAAADPSGLGITVFSGFI